ncbi:hypothetical protein WICMUC_000482 [Wickerhamomyces mucosus]|uniref:Uncharacterized protein n=1 Tax=Wickerhamomyces mucosus TaxID=1378264 RepID=A0A9P8PZ35_9ASCO|nr:hypothetical protein WICMUC_000482 [Wickerhamomyces mucosus]
MSSRPIPIKNGVKLNSFDCKIIQYQYSILKIQILIRQIKALNIRIRSTESSNPHVPLLNYIITLSGPYVNISSRLNEKLNEILQSIDIEIDKKPITSIDWDLNIEGGSFQFKDIDYTKVLEKLLKLYEIVQFAYEKELKFVKIQKISENLVDFNFDILKDLIENPLEIQSTIKFLITKDKVHQNYDIYKVPLVSDLVEKQLRQFKPFIIQLIDLSTRFSEPFLRKLENWNYLLLKIFTLLVKLNELFWILKKVFQDLNKHYVEKFVKFIKTNKILNDHYKELTKKIQLKSEEFFQHGFQMEYTAETLINFINTLKTLYQNVQSYNNNLTSFIKVWEGIEKKLALKKIESRQSSPAISVEKPVPKVQTFTKSPSQKLPISQTRASVPTEGSPQTKTQSQEKQPILPVKPGLKKLDFNSPSPEPKNLSKIQDQLKSQSQAVSPIKRSSSVIVRGNREKIGNNKSTVSNSPDTKSTLSLSSSPRTNSLTLNKLSSPPITRSPSLQKRPTSIHMSSPSFDIRSELRRQARQKASSDTANNRSNFLPSQLAVSPTPKPNFKGLDTLAGVRRARSTSLENNSDKTNSLMSNAAALAINKQVRHSSLKSISEAQSQFIEKKSLSPPKISNNRIQSIKTQQNDQLPNIGELSIKGNNDEESFRAQNNGILIDKSAKELKSNPLPPPNTVGKSNSIFNPSSSQLPENTPDLVRTSTSESSIISVTSAVNDKGMESLPSTPTGATEDENKSPSSIVKKVRFTGVPDKIEDDPKPKRRGWTVPPKLQFKSANLNGKKTPLSLAADTLQQERLVFHKVKVGEIDINAPRLGALSSPNSNGQRFGSKWRLLR